MMRPSTSRGGGEQNCSTSEPKYKGVRKRKWGKWVSEIRLPNSRERIWLGSYDSPVKAARAFDAAQFCLRGHSAQFNFPDNPPDIPRGRSLTPSEIQAAAASFANAEHPQNLLRSSEVENNSTNASFSSSESPSPSVSDGALQLDCDTMLSDATTMGLDAPLVDHFANLGSEHRVPDYGIFPGFDDLSNDYFLPPPPTSDYGEENYDDGFSQGTSSFLWNF